MVPSIWKLVVLVCLLLHSFNVQAQVFDIATANKRGSCSPYMDKINLHLVESRMLASAAQHAMDNVATDVVAQKLLTAWFGIEFDIKPGGALPKVEDLAIFTRVKMAFNLLHSFWEGHGYPNSFGKPLLFCGDDWAQPYGWNAFAFNKDGRPIVEKVNGQPTGRLVTIAQLYAGTGIVHSTNANPYWLSDLKGYIFAPNTGAHMCGDPRTGRTIALGQSFAGSRGAHLLQPPLEINTTPFLDIVMICPAAMDGTMRFRQRLGDSGWIDPRTRATLGQVIPESLTMFHETVHLVTGNLAYDPNHPMNSAQSYLVKDHASTVARCLALPSDLAADNAESYAFFAVSYWYFLNDWGKDEHGRDRQKITFYPGYVVPWDWVSDED